LTATAGVYYRENILTGGGIMTDGQLNLPDRGDLNANKDGITGTPAREQARQPAAGKPGRLCACGALEVIGNWDAEVIGNWDAVASEVDGNDAWGTTARLKYEGQRTERATAARKGRSGTEN